jgi:hypothetical protein
MADVSKHHSPKKLSSSRRKDAIESLISKPPMIVKSTISQLRYLILVDGLAVVPGSEDVSRRFYEFLIRGLPYAMGD